MCLLVLAWQSHPRYRLVVAANRDEFHERPSARLAWWSDAPSIAAGRDLRSGGTWMGATSNGRQAIVTNFRDLEAPPAPDAPSRGELVSGFLAADETPDSWIAALRPQAPRYAGFNLLVADTGSLQYFSNRDPQGPRALAPGVYGLSNHLLDSPWPKLLRTRARFAELLRGDALEPEVLLEMLADPQPANDEEIPDTGLPPEWERALSAPFVVHERYGTRCSTLLLVGHDGATTLIERRFDHAGAPTGTTRLQFEGPGVGDASRAAAHASTAAVRRGVRRIS